MWWELYLYVTLRGSGPGSRHQQQTGQSHPLEPPAKHPQSSSRLSPAPTPAEPWARPHSFGVLEKKQWKDPVSALRSSRSPGGDRATVTQNT